MRVLFTESAWEDYLYRQSTDRKTLNRINELIRDICRDPHKGIGKPEQLRFGLSGYWSRRIDHEHRLVYKIEGNSMLIAQCRYRYD